MPCRKICFLFIAFLCFTLSVKAQQADFIADTTSGCSPLTVTFKNTSTGFSSSATYLWDFGNGNTSALEDNAGANFQNEGVYTVTLTITEGSKISTKTTQITVFKKPVVDFSIDVTKGCAPLPVTFTSSSSPGDGSISTYTWDFGDGYAEAGAGTVVHTYNISKTISPSLTVTNSYGCFSTLSKPNLIEILPLVIASFKTNRKVACSLQDAITFINTSAGNGTLTYNWDFGDGNLSTVRQPNHTYNKPGTYTVKLSVTSDNGCTSDTVLTNNLNIADYHTDFDVPTKICQNTPVLFTDKSTPTPTSSSWLINGIPAGDTTSLQHTFSLPGTYKVELKNVFETCPDEAAKSVTVLPSPSTKGFIAQIQGGCGAPVTVLFTDTSKNATAWQWDFTADNTFSGNGQTASYLYTANGTYNVTLRATNANGCSAEITQPVVIQKDTVTINSSEGYLGCETKTTIFSAVSQDSITSYLWDFGDGTPTSTEATPQHTFTAPGIYNVTLQSTSAGGCKSTSTYTIKVFEKPQFDFIAKPGTTICGNNPVTFLVSGPITAGTYHWNFGDTDVYNVETPPYTHSYQYDSVFSVSLIIDNNGCRDTVTKPAYITVLPPFPHVVSITNTCDGTRGLVTFKDSSQKALQYSWDFGDGSLPYTYTSPQVQVQHQYNKSGYYKAILTTTNDACSVIDSADVYVLLKQTPDLSASAAKFCSGDTLKTFISGLDNNPYSGDALQSYYLTSVLYKDGSSFTGNITIPDSLQLNPFGVQLNGLDVTQSQLRITTTSAYFGCADTTDYISFHALGPIAAFTVSPDNICFKKPFVFDDQSQPSHGSPIVKWEWNFGDNVSQTNIQNTSVIHRYENPGIYYPVLTVTDANNCRASASLPNDSLVATGPKAMFTISENPVLPQTPVIFYNETNTINTDNATNKYTWDFDDGTILRNQVFANSVSHSYTGESIDTVTLIASNAAASCIDTATQIVYVKNPNLSFTDTTSYVNPESGCPPVIASFVNTSINTESVSWDFGDGNNGENNNASHIYEKPGTYKVTLYGHFLDGSVDSIFEYITIKGPFARLATVKPYACGAELITLTASLANTRNFTWDFGDGTIISNTDTFASHRYLTPGVYTPSLIVSDSSSCKFPFFLTKPIIIDTLHLHINQNPQIACDSSLLLFTPDIVSEAKNELGLPLTYHWSFGTGINKDTANTETSSFIYNKPGTYEVILSGSSPYGCTDLTRDTVVVQPTPKAFIAGPAQICQGDSALFTGSATGTVTWNWQFTEGVTFSVQNPTKQAFPTPGLDSISLIVNENGCYDTAWHLLQVNAIPVINPLPLTTHLCEGDSVKLEAHDGTTYQWTPVRNIYQPNTATPFVFPDTTTTYYVAVKNEAGCTNKDSVIIDVTQHFTVTTPSPVYICPGGVAQLNAYGAENYHWLNDNLSNVDISKPTTSVYAPQTFTVVGFDNFGCFNDTATAQVLTATLPTVNAGADITTFAGTSVLLQAAGSSDIVKWLWIPATNIVCDTCAGTTLTPRDNMQYILKVTNGSGCVAYDSLQVTIQCKLSLVQIPSAFTPNGDGKNDYFTIKGRGIKQIKHFAVFDRLGEMLFEQSNLDIGESVTNGWDGTYKNMPLEPGTYVYMADLVCDTGEVFHYKGTVVLIR